MIVSGLFKKNSYSNLRKPQIFYALVKKRWLGGNENSKIGFGKANISINEM